MPKFLSEESRSLLICVSH